VCHSIAGIRVFVNNDFTEKNMELDFGTLKTEYSNRLARVISGLLLPGIGNTQFTRFRI
jgi:hypothetical protein